MASDSCGWCQVAYWQFICFTCDPRRAKALCTDCCILWHSRGVSRDHQLTSNYGETRSFSTWMPSQEKSVTNDSIGMEAQIRALHGSIDTAVDVHGQGKAVRKEEDKELGGSEKQESPKVEDGKVSNDSNKDVEERNKEEKNGQEMMVKDVERQQIKLQEKTIDILPTVTPADVNSVSQLERPVERNGHKMEEQAKTNDPEEHESVVSKAIAVQDVSPAPLSSAAATIPSVQDRDGPLASVENPFAFVSIHAPPSTTSTPDTAIASKSHEYQENLENLLKSFPTSDRSLMEKLAARIEKAIVIEDALICAQFGKCQELPCRSVLQHYEHCKQFRVCGDPMCVEMSLVYEHRRTCSKEDHVSTSDGKQVVCPFCIRIRQRRSLGIVAALNHLIGDQYRALQEARSEENRNVCLKTINMWNQRKRALRAKVDRLNRLAIESDTLIFNFPRYQWHFRDAIFVKQEPTFLGNKNNTTELCAPKPSTNGTNEQTAAEEAALTCFEDEDKVDSDAVQSEDVQDDNTTNDASFDVDYINELLWAKDDECDERELLQRKFEEAMELGYAIVDVSFCTPSAAQQCLLGCKAILMHLQHHLDLQVCTQTMCTAIEHHFSHLSQCKARGTAESCEYCLRVEERQLIRSIDFMEAEQPEAEAKVQNIINEISASFTNNHPDQREQEVIQLEDELEQAEANKQELLEKLSTARMNLRKVCRSMERHGISNSSNRQLPVHFVKVRRVEGLRNNSKKRRRASSLDK